MADHSTPTRYAAVSVMTLCALFSARAPLGAEAPIPEGTVPEAGLRRLATRRVVPAYPVEALRQQRAGVAVARLRVSEAGRPVEVRVLESPAPPIDAALIAALSQWQFPPLTDGAGNPKRVTGRLTFYYVIRDGKGIVLDPQDAGYVGRWPQDSRPTPPPAIDVRERDVAAAGPAAAIRMPLDEIEVRAPHELPKDAAIEVRCGDVVYECLAGVQVLKMIGFERASSPSANPAR